MIGEALYDLLSTNASLLAIHEGRVSPVMFDQEINKDSDTVPASIYYNTKGLKRLLCRAPSRTREGLLKIGAIASNSVEIETLCDTLNEVLDGYTGTHLGYRLSLEVNDDDFDDSDPDLGAFYKELYFDLTATQL